LSRDIVHKLRHGQLVLPELFETVTLSFTDLVDFVEFVSVSPVLDVISFLNQSHGLFDQVITGYDVYKVETIGDSYMVRAPSKC
jgi:class 3 adenylate cyclase